MRTCATSRPQIVAPHGIVGGVDFAVPISIRAAAVKNCRGAKVEPPNDVIGRVDIAVRIVVARGGRRIQEGGRFFDLQLGQESRHLIQHRMNRCVASVHLSRHVEPIDNLQLVFVVGHAGELLNLLQVFEAGLDRGLKHRTFAEVVKGRQLQEIHLGRIQADNIQHVRERLTAIMRNVEGDYVADATLRVKIIEAGVSPAANRTQAGRSELIEVRLMREMVVETFVLIDPGILAVGITARVVLFIPKRQKIDVFTRFRQNLRPLS